MILDSFASLMLKYQIFNTAKNASCGILTWSKRRMRFLLVENKTIQ